LILRRGGKRQAGEVRAGDLLKRGVYCRESQFGIPNISASAKKIWMGKNSTFDGQSGKGKGVNDRKQKCI